MVILPLPTATHKHLWNITGLRKPWVWQNQPYLYANEIFKTLKMKFLKCPFLKRIHLKRKTLK